MLTLPHRLGNKTTGGCILQGEVHDPDLVSDGFWQGLADARVAVRVLPHLPPPAWERLEV